MAGPAGWRADAHSWMVYAPTNDPTRGITSPVGYDWTPWRPAWVRSGSSGGPVRISTHMRC